MMLQVSKPSAVAVDHFGPFMFETYPAVNAIDIERLDKGEKDDRYVVEWDEELAPEPTEATLVTGYGAWLKSSVLIPASKMKVGELIAAIINPLDGNPLSTSGDPGERTLGGLVAWANARDYIDDPAADGTVVTAIKAAVAEKNRLLAIHKQTRADIDGGLITDIAQIIAPARWA